MRHLWSYPKILWLSFLLVGVATAGVLDPPAYANRTASVMEIFVAYVRNEIAADQHYKGQRFKIFGTAETISGGKKPSIKFVLPIYNNEYFYFHCQFSNPKGLDKIEAGQRVTLTGVIDGLHGNTIRVKDCTL